MLVFGRVGAVCRRHAARSEGVDVGASGEDAAAFERAFQCVAVVHSTVAESGDLLGGVQAGVDFTFGYLASGRRGRFGCCPKFFVSGCAMSPPINGPVLGARVRCGVAARLSRLANERCGCPGLGSLC